MTWSNKSRQVTATTGHDNNQRETLFNKWAMSDVHKQVNSPRILAQCP